MRKRLTAALSVAASTLGMLALSALPAYAEFNIDTAISNSTNAIQKAFVLILIVAAIWRFLKHAVVQAVVLVLIGGLVYAALNASVLTSIGNGILALFGAK